MLPGHGEFKNSSCLTRWVLSLLFLDVVLSGVLILSNQMEFGLLTDLQAGKFANKAEIVAASEANDRRQSMLDTAALAFYILCGVLILRWIYRANYNARQIGAAGMTFSPGWSVGWYFVPIAAFWKPYQAMKEIWRAARVHRIGRRFTEVRFCPGGGSCGSPRVHSATESPATPFVRRRSES